MTRTLPISEVKAHLPALVAGVAEREEEIIVTRKGRPAAVIVNVAEYESMRETLEILADARLVAAIRRGRAYFRRGGKGVPLRELDERPTRTRTRR
jgi:prevent-host-death family protein